MNFEKMAEVLSAHPDYKVIRRFQPRTIYHPATGKEIRKGIFLDAETSGTDTATADLLELALVPFIYEAGGRLLGIRDDQCNSFLNEPSKPLTEEIRKLTGITDADLIGQSIARQMGTIEFILRDVDLVVAHNAGFDRKITERYVPVLRDLPWACSWQDVPWREKFHAPSQALEVLALTLGGIFYNAHRAMIDCLIGVDLLARIEDREGVTAFEYLEHASEQESVRVWAVGAPFSTKDALSFRGYRWNDGRDGRPKAWSKVIPNDLIQDEIALLRREFGAYPQVTVTEAVDRYSIRER